jgi:hypothetical protein
VEPKTPENIYFLTNREMEIMNQVRVVVHRRIVSTVKRVQFVSDRMTYIILKGHWCQIIVL